MLYDSTKCIGCKSCVVACAEANGLSPDTRVDSLHQSPNDLNSFTKNIIKLYKPADGDGSYSLREAPVHALSRSVLRGRVPISCAAEKSCHRRRGLGRRRSASVAATARSPARTRFRSSSGKRFNAQDREVRILQGPPGKGPGAGVHHCVSDEGGDLRTPRRAAERSHRRESRTLRASISRTACTARRKPAERRCCICRRWTSTSWDCRRCRRTSIPSHWLQWSERVQKYFLLPDRHLRRDRRLPEAELPRARSRRWMKNRRRRD